MDKISFIKEKEILKLQKYFIEMKICKQKMNKKKRKKKRDSMPQVPVI
jgi:hypothetical protein